MSTEQVPEPSEQVLEVDREEFALRLGAITKMDGVGRMPIVLKFDGKNLVLTYGGIVRIAADGNWTAEAQLSKAAVKKFVKEYEGPRLVDESGQVRAYVSRFVAGFGGRASALLLVRQGDDALLIDGYTVPCQWLESHDQKP